MKSIFTLVMLTSAVSQASYYCEVKCKSVNNAILFNNYWDYKENPWSDLQEYCKDLGGDILKQTDMVMGCPRQNVVCAKSGTETTNEGSAYGDELPKVKAQARKDCFESLPIEHDCVNRFEKGRTVILSENCR
ncbi:MAG: hypothetical protein SGI74_14350 [Oligoflexia bacterium]|nr:hypothetical protein [Oligoflexia bacterium]